MRRFACARQSPLWRNQRLHTFWVCLALGEATLGKVWTVSAKAKWPPTLGPSSPGPGDKAPKRACVRFTVGHAEPPAVSVPARAPPGSPCRKCASVRLCSARSFWVPNPNTSRTRVKGPHGFVCRHLRRSQAMGLESSQGGGATGEGGSCELSVLLRS